MERFIRVAFWTVTLFWCLQARPFRPTRSLKEANIDQMRRHVKCPQNSTFYTPKDVEAKCIVKALECVRLELEGPAADECNDTRGEIRAAVAYLNVKRLKNRTPDNSSECDCHKWEQKPFNEFLNETVALLQSDNDIQSSQ